MDKNDKIKSQLLKLAKLNVAQDKKEENGEEEENYFTEIFDLQSEILKSFGLTESTEFQGLLWFKEVPTDFELGEKIKELHTKASEYLLSKPKPELEILREAQAAKENPFIVLPELKISTHTYTRFVYNRILLKNKDSVENILDEFKLVEEKGLLGIIASLQQNYPTEMADIHNLTELTFDYSEPEIVIEINDEKTNMKYSDVVNYLEGKGVKYIHRFLNSESNLLSDDDY